MLWPWKLILCVQVCHHLLMTPIDFEVTRSKVKVMIAFSRKMVFTCFHSITEERLGVGTLYLVSVQNYKIHLHHFFSSPTTTQMVRQTLFQKSNL